MTKNFLILRTDLFVAESEKITDKKIFDAILSQQEVMEAIAKMVSITPFELEEYLKGKSEKECGASIYIDGGARGNPGDSGCAVVIESGNKKNGYYYYLGRQTNNMAEYTALKYALELSIKQKIKDIVVYSDSELVCKQIRGIYKIKNLQLKKIFDEILSLKEKLNSFQIHHIRRNFNKEADKLANMAMDEKRDGKVEFTVAT